MSEKGILYHHKTFILKMIYTILLSFITILSSFVIMIGSGEDTLKQMNEEILNHINQK